MWRQLFGQGLLRLPALLRPYAPCARRAPEHPKPCASSKGGSVQSSQAAERKWQKEAGRHPVRMALQSPNEDFWGALKGLVSGRRHCGACQKLAIIEGLGSGSLPLGARGYGGALNLGALLAERPFRSDAVVKGIYKGAWGKTSEPSSVRVKGCGFGRLSCGVACEARRPYQTGALPRRGSGGVCLRVLEASVELSGRSGSDEALAQPLRSALAGSRNIPQRACPIMCPTQ